MNPHRIILEDAYKRSRLDQDKVLEPLETISLFRDRLKKMNLDLLKDTVRIDNGRLDIPVFFSLCGKDALNITGQKKYMGKGGTACHAEASAIMELAERFSFFSFRKNKENFIIEEYRNVKDKALSFETIAMSVHDDSADLDRVKDVFFITPLKWTWAWNLTSQEQVLIPFDWFCAINEFNGASAGNCREEAIIQGICEVVERHASSLVSGNRLLTPSINVESVSDPMSVEMIGKYRREGIRLHLNDLSLDTGMPTVAALAYDPATFPQMSEIVWTAGTAPDPQKALNRALSETAQLAGDFNTGACYMASGLSKLRSLDDARFIIENNSTKRIQDLPDLSDDNIKNEIENCVSALSARGMEVIVVNTTHPQLGIPAFYTIIPGAHFRERAKCLSMGMYITKIIAENEEPERAIKKLKDMNILLPERYYIMFFLGVLHLSKDDPVKGLEYLEKAMSLDPKEEDVPGIYSYMAQCLKETQQYEEAIRVLEKAEKYDNERTDIYNLMGFCHFKLKEHKEAIRCFEKVLKLNPGSGIDYANIASNYRELGNREQAIRYYRIALDIDPTIDFASDNLKTYGIAVK